MYAVKGIFVTDVRVCKMDFTVHRNTIYACHGRESLRSCNALHYVNDVQCYIQAEHACSD